MTLAELEQEISGEPPADFRSPDWHAQEANNIVRLLEVAYYLPLSRWFQQERSYSILSAGDGKKKFKETSLVPDVLETNSVLMFIRQLYSEKDNIVKQACNSYLAHTSNDRRAMAIGMLEDEIKKTLDGYPGGFLTDCTGKQVLRAL